MALPAQTRDAHGSRKHLGSSGGQVDNPVYPTGEIDLGKGDPRVGEEIRKARAGCVPATFFEVVLCVIVRTTEVEIVETSVRPLRAPRLTDLSHLCSLSTVQSRSNVNHLTDSGARGRPPKLVAVAGADPENVGHPCRSAMSAKSSSPVTSALKKPTPNRANKALRERVVGNGIGSPARCGHQGGGSSHAGGQVPVVIVGAIHTYPSIDASPRHARPEKAVLQVTPRMRPQSGRLSF
jgi:hypothetical protein